MSQADASGALIANDPLYQPIGTLVTDHSRIPQNLQARVAGGCGGMYAGTLGVDEGRLPRPDTRPQCGLEVSLHVGLHIKHMDGQVQPMAHREIYAMPADELYHFGQVCKLVVSTLETLESREFGSIGLNSRTRGSCDGGVAHSSEMTLLMASAMTALRYKAETSLLEAVAGTVRGMRACSSRSDDTARAWVTSVIGAVLV